MSDVLIKSVEMPKSCDVCGFREEIVVFGEELSRYYCGFPGLGMNVEDYIICRHSDCPLVELPPHGRLIDAEIIYDAVERRYRMSSGIEHRCERDLLDLICSAPTIIQAEPGEEMTEDRYEDWIEHINKLAEPAEEET